MISYTHCKRRLRTITLSSLQEMAIKWHLQSRANAAGSECSTARQFVRKDIKIMNHKHDNKSLQHCNLTINLPGLYS